MPPKPPQPPPVPPSIDIMGLLNSLYSHNNTIISNRASPSLSNNSIYEYFFANSKCLKFDSENFLAYNSSKQRIINNSSSTTFSNSNSIVFSNQTFTNSSIFIKSSNSIHTETTYTNRNATADVKIYRPVLTNSTFYIINLFLLSICLISIFLFIVMILLMAKRYILKLSKFFHCFLKSYKLKIYLLISRCNKNKKQITTRSSSSASSSSSSISFVACYSASLNSSLQSGIKTLEKNTPHGISIHSLTEINNLQSKLKKTQSVKNKHICQENILTKRPTEYYTIGDDAYFYNNFQLKSKPDTDINEYYAIHDTDFMQFNQNCNFARESVYTIPIERHRSNLSEYYCIEKDSKVELNPTYLNSLNRELEGYYAFLNGHEFNSDILSSKTTRIFPRTNPLCRNANYYGKIPAPSQEEIHMNKIDNLCSKL